MLAVRSTSAMNVCRVSGLCLTEKDMKGARGGDRISNMGLPERELNRLPTRGGTVGSSAQSLNFSSEAMDATRLGCIVDGSQWISDDRQYGNTSLHSPAFLPLLFQRYVRSKYH